MNGSEATADEGVTYRDFDAEKGSPEIGVVRTVAELEGVDPTDLPDLYSTVNNLLEHVFSDPPDDDAGVRVEFTYVGYRIAIGQDGRASFRTVDR